MLKLNYFIHLLLNSNYRLLIHISVLVLIYFCIYDTKIGCCMNNNINVIETPIIAEAKDVINRPSQQLLAIKREIVTYAGGHAHFIERLDEQTRIIEEQKSVISEMQNEIIRLKKDVEIGKMHEREMDDLNIYKKQMEQYRNSLKHDISVAKQGIEWAERELNMMEECTKRTEQIIKDRFWDEYHKR